MTLIVNNLKANIGTDFLLHIDHFSIQEGEILGVLGESGSGKSSLLRALCGLQESTGEIQFKGDQIENIKPEKRGIGMIFQQYALFPHLTVKKNILFGISKQPKTEQENILKSILKLTSLEGLESRRPEELSGGQQQRVAIARSLAPNPRVLLLDEPFSNLDHSLRSRLRNEVRSILKSKSTTSLFVTHDLQDVVEVADKIMVLKSGEIAQFGTLHEIYFKPKTKYVAELFGEINWLDEKQKLALNLTPEVSGLRPRSFDFSTEELQGTVMSFIFSGDHYAIKVEVNGELFNAIYSTIPSIGEKLSFGIRENETIQL